MKSPHKYIKVKPRIDNSVPESFRSRSRNFFKNKKKIPKRGNNLKIVKSPWAKASTPISCRPLKKERSPNSLLSDWLKSRGINVETDKENQLIRKIDLKSYKENSSNVLRSCTNYINTKKASAEECKSLLNEVVDIMPEAKNYSTYWLTKAMIAEKSDEDILPVFSDALQTITDIKEKEIIEEASTSMIKTPSKEISDTEDEVFKSPQRGCKMTAYSLTNITPQFKRLKDYDNAMLSIVTPVRRSIRLFTDDKDHLAPSDLTKPHQIIVKHLQSIPTPNKVKFRYNLALEE